MKRIQTIDIARGLFLLLSFTQGVQNTASRWLTVYGKVPLFFYIIH